jgi:enoyl-[acyl-carrier protein] reductase II
MKTKMTELLGIKYPIMLAGMAYVAVPKLVAAVSNAGGLGMLNPVIYTPEGAREAIREVRSLTDKPFAVNITLLLPGARENAVVALEEKVPVINYSLGRADWIIKAAHEYGGKVLGTVVMQRHARRSELDGADFLIVTGHEAAAHGGDISSLVLLPLARTWVNIPIIAAGGFSDGKGLAAALALGAEGISMGTRFMLAQESPVHDNFKQVCLQAAAEDTIYTDRIDGLPGRYLKTKAAEIMTRQKVASPIKALSNARDISRMLKVPLWKLFLSGLKMRSITGLASQAVATGGLRTAIEQGDVERGLLPVGQVTGIINDLPTCKEVIEQTVAEAKEVLEATRAKLLS